MIATICVVVLTMTVIAALIVLVLSERRLMRQEMRSHSEVWKVELWNISHGYRVCFSFQNHCIVGREVLCNADSADGVGYLDQTISREQCMLYENAGVLCVWNLSNANCTVINGYRLNEPRQLLTGDRLGMGNSTFLVTRLEKIYDRDL